MVNNILGMWIGIMFLILMLLTSIRVMHFLKKTWQSVTTPPVTTLQVSETLREMYDAGPVVDTSGKLMTNTRQVPHA